MPGRISISQWIILHVAVSIPRGGIPCARDDRVRLGEAIVNMESQFTLPFYINYQPAGGCIRSFAGLGQSTPMIHQINADDSPNQRR
jgi:hypothetical protein